MQIKNRYTGEIIVDREAGSVKELVEYCIKNKLSLFQADLRGSNLRDSNLSYIDLRGSNLRDSNLSYSDLSYSNLMGSNLSYSDLRGSNLRDSNLRDSDLSNVKGLIKIMGVERGNYYYKRIGNNLINNGYQFKVGLNILKEGEVFANDERELCSYPGFHFASKSWCALHYSSRPYEAKIRIPEDAQINEPWATDGKASADKIEIVQVIDTRTREDVTEKFK